MADDSRSNFTVHVHQSEHMTTVQLSGEIDVESVQAIETATTEADATTHRVVLDLAGVSFIDSSGLHVLVSARRRLGDRFELGPISDVVERVMQLAGLDVFLRGDGRPPTGA